MEHFKIEHMKGKLTFDWAPRIEDLLAFFRDHSKTLAFTDIVIAIGVHDAQEMHRIRTSTVDVEMLEQAMSAMAEAAQTHRIRLWWRSAPPMDESAITSTSITPASLSWPLSSRLR